MRYKLVARLEMLAFWVAVIITYPILVGFNMLWNIWNRKEYAYQCAVCGKTLTRWQRVWRTVWACWALTSITPKMTCSFRCSEKLAKNMGGHFGEEEAYYRPSR